MGRSARGVRGIRLRPGDRVVGADLVDEDRQLLVLSSKGYGKLTKISNFPTHKRGGVGIKAAVVNTKTGDLVSVHTMAPETKEILVISTHGQAIRIGVKDIPVLGRTTQGVRIMRLNGDDTVASVGLVADEVSEELEEAAAKAEEAQAE
jgi:DNA gyrase subunit A